METSNTKEVHVSFIKYKEDIINKSFINSLASNGARGSVKK